MTLDDVPGRFAYTEDHEAFRQTVRSFLQKEGVPNVNEWEEAAARPQGFLAQGGRDRDAVPDRAGGIWRARPRLRL